MAFQPYLIQSNKPLFPKVLWNRPVARSSSGRVLLVGGHRYEFAAVQQIYQYILPSGIGKCTVALPDSLRAVLQYVDDAQFVPSSPSGSIGRGALAELASLALDHDAISTGANLSNNSETTVAIERLLGETSKRACLYLDALDIINIEPKLVTESPQICLVVTMPELFKLASRLGVALHVRPERELIGRVELVQSIAANLQASLVCIGKEMIVVSADQTSVTPDTSIHINPAIYAITSAFWTHKQNFEHLTTAAYIIQFVSKSLSELNNPGPVQIVKAIGQAIEVD